MIVLFDYNINKISLIKVFLEINQNQFINMM